MTCLILGILCGFLLTFVNGSVKNLAFDGETVQRLVQRVAELEMKMKVDHQRTAELEEKVNSQQVTISLMNSQLENQNLEIVILRRELDELKMDRVNEQSDEHRMPTSYKNISEEIEVGNGTDIIQTKYVDDLMAKQRTHKRSLVRNVTSTPTAFYAIMTTNENSVVRDQILVFRTLITNIGNAYNYHTGIFTAPVSGVYVFSYTITPENGAYIPVQLKKNSVTVGYTSAQSYSSFRHDTSVTIVLELSTGDICYVSTSSGHTPSGPIRSSIDAKSSFSGWLLA